MPNSKWLWLSEAADRIASRLTEAEPAQLGSRTKALKIARDQLLDEAYRGSIEVRGKYADPQEQEPRFDPQGWKVVDAEFWDPIHRQRRARSPLKVKLTWNKNFFLYDEEGVEAMFHSLQVADDDIDRIWPARNHTNPGGDANREQSVISGAAGPPKNKGGRPPKYRALLLELIAIANTPDGLLEPHSEFIDRPRLRRELHAFGVSYWGPDDQPSNSLIDSLLKEVADWLAQKR